MSDRDNVIDNNHNIAKQAHDQLHCQLFKGYHMTYLKCDVLLLVDVLKNCRQTCMEKMDHSNYLAPPG